MIKYTFEGKVDPELFDLALFDIDHKVEIRIECGPNINFNDANKIAALGQPVFVKAFSNEGIKETVANLVTHDAKCVIVELPISAFGLSSGKVYEFIGTYLSDSRFDGSKLCLINAEHMTYIVDDDQWNTLIVHCYDHMVPLCWAYNAANARYTQYLQSII